MIGWLQVAQECHCCSRLADPERLRPYRRAHAVQYACAPTAQRCQARQRPPGRAQCHSTITAAAYSPQNVSTADLEHRPLSRFEGLSWVQEQEHALRREADARPQPKPVPRTMDESHSRRHPYHRKLLAALSRNSVPDVEDILQTMQEDDLEPGPLAYNTLVVAHVKNGNLDAALDILQDLHYQGLQPTQQSYCALIHGSVRSGQLTLAEEVLHQMKESRISSYPGWLVLTKQLWAKGHTDLAQAYLRERQQDWKVDGDIYEHVIRHVCSDPGDDAQYLLNPDFSRTRQHTALPLDQHASQISLASAAMPQDAAAEESKPMLDGTVQKIWADMRASQVPIETRHCNLILKQSVKSGNIRSAERTIADMSSGQLAPPNAASFECLAEAYAISNGGHLDDQLYGLTKSMTQLGLQPTKRMHSLGMEAALRTNNLEMALNKLKGMREAGLGIMQLLSDSVLASLLWKLSCNNQPADLMRTLKTMQRDDKYFASGSHNEHDAEGRSFLTAWLAARPRASVQGFQGLPNEPVNDVVEIDGCRLLRNKYILNEAGKVVAPSNMTLPQLKVELTARQLSLLGNRTELKKRIMAARAADPPDIALELRQRQDAKKVKQRKQADREEAKRAAHAQAVASGQDGKTKVEFKTWGSGGIVAQKSEEVKVEDDAEEGVVLDDDDADADLPDEPLQPMKTAVLREGYDDDDAVGDGVHDDDDDNASLNTCVAVSAAAVPVQQTFTNQNAGVDAAMQLLRLTISLNGVVTAADYQTLLEAAEQEGSANAAWTLVRLWHQTLQDAYDAQTVNKFYNRALLVCKQAANPALASEVLQKMQTLDISEQQHDLKA